MLGVQSKGDVRKGTLLRLTPYPAIWAATKRQDDSHTTFTANPHTYTSSQGARRVAFFHDARLWGYSVYECGYPTLHSLSDFPALLAFLTALSGKTGTLPVIVVPPTLKL